MSEFAELDEVERSSTPDSELIQDDDDLESLVGEEEDFVGVEPFADQPIAMIPDEYEPAAPHQPRFVSRREKQVSPSDEALIKDILEKYPGAVDIDPKTIRDLAQAELHQLAMDVGVGGLGIQEIVDINVPRHRIKPIAPLMRRKLEYDPYLLYKIYMELTYLEPQSAREIFDIIWSSKKPVSDKITELGKVIYHTEIHPDNVAYIHKKTGMDKKIIIERFKSIQDLLNEDPGNYNETKKLFFKYPPPHELIAELKKQRISRLEKFPDIVRPENILQIGTKTIDPVKTHTFGARILLDSLLKLGLLQIPQTQAQNLATEMFEMKTCDVWDLRGCSKQAREFIPGYKIMAEYISNRLAEKYPDVQQYIAALSIILLHLDRSNPVGFYSTEFQYNLFSNPELAVSANYQQDILPKIFKSTRVKKMVAEEREDAYKDLVETMYSNQFKKPPQYGEQRHMIRLDRHADLEQTYGSRRPEYEIYRESQQKKFSITVGDTTYIITGSARPIVEDDLLFDDLYMIRYMPMTNNYLIIHFIEKDGKFSPSIIGMSREQAKHTSYDLDVSLDKSYTLSQINSLFIPHGFYRITDDQFLDTPEPVAKIFSRAQTKSKAPKLFVEAKPLKMKKHAPVPPVSKNYTGLKQVLNEMGGQI